jgi:SAM-dependent methyltransferase
MTYFFDQYPEFVDIDLRKVRKTTTVSSESLHKRCAVLLPKWLIEGKTILDLGHCVGAFGQWALANGAAHYTGVDINRNFCNNSKILLGKYWKEDQFNIICSDVLNYLKENNKQYDIVVASGVIHGYLDVFQVIKLISETSSEYIVIETLDIKETLSPAILFKNHKMTSNYIQHHHTGWTPLIGFDALRAVMNEYGYLMHGERIYPEKIVNSHDAYNDDVKIKNNESLSLPDRYMVRYHKSNTIKKSLQNSIATNTVSSRANVININDYIITKPDVWSFDDSVADRFQDEAVNNIPDYARVIDMCIQLAESKVTRDAVVVDIGSALGYTIDKFLNKGFSTVYGIENSDAMISKSKHQDKIICSDKFPELKSDFVMANWTLHFVVERKDYIQSIYNNMNEDGVLIVSDKTTQTPEVKELYYNFKRDNGVTDEYIYEKEKKLQGYMHPYPIEWYLDTLKQIGFKNIQIINSRYGFVTFYATKS